MLSIIMRQFFIGFVFAVFSYTVSAEDVLDCAAIYQQLKNKVAGNVSVCEPNIKEAEFEQCTVPSNYSGERPASHVILVLDASGSMAGKIGGETKMAVAKREALAFMNDVQKDVPVGLMVYGHRGNNKESGKAESCAATEWAHKVGASRADLAKSINALKPTGWTPLGGVLSYAQEELAKLPKKPDEKIAAPVLYLISDGEETCGGDPIAAAKMLYESGVRAAVNVIGFDVNAETRIQLEEISKAGGGRYFPADDTAALRSQLQAIRESEQSLARYNYCISINQGRAAMSYHNAIIEMTGCFQKETKAKRLTILMKKAKEMEASDGPEQACAAEVKRAAYDDYVQELPWLTERVNEMRSAQERAMDDAYSQSIFNALDK